MWFIRSGEQAMKWMFVVSTWLLLIFLFPVLCMIAAGSLGLIIVMRARVRAKRQADTFLPR